MHEGPIVQSIIDTVIDTLREKEITGAVKRVNLTIGKAQGLVPDAMQLFFDVHKADTALADAELVIELQPIVARCSACDHEREMDEPFMFCPACGAAMDMIKGKELMLTSIEVDQ